MARYVVTFDTSDAAVLQQDAPGLLSSEGFSAETYFSRLGIGVVESDPEQMTRFSSRCREQNRPMSFTPELTYYAISEPPGGTYADTSELTWGLQAIGIASAQEQGRAGAGVRAAVLDTGFAADHADFASRSVTTASFVDGQGPEDAHGHGTHCVGTACGPWAPPGGPGYGVAAESEIYAGKVLGDDGSGSDTSILAGIEWALEHDCQIISMSLGADVREVHPPYVAAGRRALERGSLIIAAAGNNARRSAGDCGFVGSPANSPHIIAVGAVDSQLRTADFSARSLQDEGGEVNLAAPGGGCALLLAEREAHHQWDIDGSPACLRRGSPHLRGHWGSRRTAVAGTGSQCRTAGGRSPRGRGGWALPHPGLPSAERRKLRADHGREGMGHHREG
ncbi:S8 family serine peptidase [Nesterenkonia populi]|uniref:S8 family serine peptidase n=1 Tax=Nesterenkonia populi TaxID=1591087 RepID=UPI001FE711E7